MFLLYMPNTINLTCQTKNILALWLKKFGIPLVYLLLVLQSMLLTNRADIFKQALTIFFIL